MSFDVVKAGTVQRLSTVLRRWKSAFIVVYADGHFRYFDKRDDFVPKSTVYIPSGLKRVISNPHHIEPPSGCSKKSIFGFATHESEWFFCADSPDDAVAWCLALSEARRIQSPRQTHIPPAAAHGGYTDGSNYYRHSAYPEAPVPLYDSNYPSNIPTIPTAYRGTDGQLIIPQQVIEHPDGSRTIVLGQGSQVMCRCRRGYDCGCGYGYGFGDAALLGLAAGTLMWSPFMWGPCFW